MEGGTEVEQVASTEAALELDSLPAQGKDATADAIDIQSKLETKTALEETSEPQSENRTSTVPRSEVAHPDAGEDYSIFTTAQKRAIILTASLAGWFSPMSGSIYYPALNQVRPQYNEGVSYCKHTVAHGIGYGGGVGKTGTQED